ncbi:MAG: FAD-dependent oxidoreductase [Chloroflexi bacterium]|nr:FAD-dependent oxidoreductase [Chloroflexota bacterium]
MPKVAAPRILAPCVRECPANIDVPRYIGLIEQGRFAEAVAVVRERTPLPSICSHVCYHPCEAFCRRASLDSTVAINALKRAATDRDTQLWRRNWQTSIAPSSGKRVAVIGSGPAGLTAAYYLGKVCGHAVTVFEALPQPGGQLRIGIPAYRLPRSVLEEEIAVIAETRVGIQCNYRVEALDQLFAQGFNAVFVATGACPPNALGCPGEELPGVLTCVDLLREANLGGRPTIGEKVAVVGGGNVAIDGARVALRLGAKEVAILYRRTRQEMPAHDFEVHEAEVEGVALRFLAAPLRIEPGKSRRLRVVLQQMQLGEPDSSGRRRPVPIPGDVATEEVDTLLVAIGQHPEAPASWDLELNGDGTIRVDPATWMTSRPGVFAGGDAVSGPVNVVEAVSAGRRAAEGIDRHLGGDGNIEEVLAPTEAQALDFPTVVHPVGREAERMVALEAQKRVSSFAEVELGYTEPQAIEEARRCIRCDLWRYRGVPAVWPKGKKVAPMA